MAIKELLEQSGKTVVETDELFKDRPEFSSLRKEMTTTPVLQITESYKDMAVRLGLIPKAYINCEFNIEKIKENQRNQAKVISSPYIVQNADAYFTIATDLISTITHGALPDQSYLIGAPNGYGKTSLANTCILRMFISNKNCVPFITLWDLAQIKVREEKRLIRGVQSRDIYGNPEESRLEIELRNYQELYEKRFNEPTCVKIPVDIINKFSWSEYMNSDVLFCSFTDVSSRVLESEIFKTVLMIRGMKGLPTIGMISTSLNPYKNDDKLGKLVWAEILACENSNPSYDRVRHISCFKNYNIPLTYKARGADG